MFVHKKKMKKAILLLFILLIPSISAYQHFGGTTDSKAFYWASEPMETNDYDIPVSMFRPVIPIAVLEDGSRGGLRRALSLEINVGNQSKPQGFLINGTIKIRNDGGDIRDGDLQYFLQAPNGSIYNLKSVKVDVRNGITEVPMELRIPYYAKLGTWELGAELKTPYGSAQDKDQFKVFFGWFWLILLSIGLYRIYRYKKDAKNTNDYDALAIKPPFVSRT